MTALVAFTAEGLALARRLAAGLPDARVHGFAPRCDGADVPFADTGEHLRALFEDGEAIVGICAAAILVRSLAPALADKRAEPPVLAVSEDGATIVPLLGGHRGGHRLAAEIAAATGGVPALTTAGDRRFAAALDDPPAGWRLAAPERAKPLMAALLAGETLALEGEADWLDPAALPLSAEARWRLRAGIEAGADDPCELVIAPQRLAIGVGCERGCPPGELRDLVHGSLREAGLLPAAAAVVVSLDLKMDEPAVQALAEDLGVPARFFAAGRLEDERARMQTPSEAVFREVGTHGVAEGAALAAVGPEGRLRLAKRKSRRATCAIAEAPAPLAVETIGRARGLLSVIGLGPGDPDWRVLHVRRRLAGLDDLVGYSLYLDQIGPEVRARRHGFALGEEEARVRHALALAAEGRRVGLICSGDPGIYAMASLVYEALDGDGGDLARAAVVEVLPGLTAMQAAAARLGAPLGHDFCAVSLSDLMTPWPAIERRLRAAAEGDFVTALYNPRSRGRPDHLAGAFALFAEHRPGETPVAFARNLGRPGESLEVTTLEAARPEAADMLTLVLIGASSSRMLLLDGRPAVYTPRGYGLTP